MAEYYPRWEAGQDITADLLNAGLPRVIRKTADTVKNNTTTVAADPELQISLEANAVYVWEGWLKYDVRPTSDIQIDFSAPSGALGEWAGMGAGSGTGASTAAGYSIRTETNDITQLRTYYGTTASNPMALFLYGTIRMGSTSGTFSLDWAPANAVAEDTTVYTDSWLKFQRIA